MVWAAACSDGSSTHDHAAHAVVSIAPIGAPDSGFSGPQGRVPQFVVECAHSHTLDDDPIVLPGQPGRSHLHEFFGNTSTDASSTLDSLEAATTTCDQQLDRAAYWVPALYDGEDRVEPEKVDAYYRPGPGVAPSTVRAYPAGLQLLGGDPSAEVAQPLTRVAWSCGTGAERAIEPPTCPSDRGLRLLVTFPDCWDGVRLSSADHRDHAAYSSGGVCDASHPVPIPQLTLSVAYPITGAGGPLSLASGTVLTGHADFFNAWDQSKLESEVANCLNRELVCSITSGRKSG